MSRTARVDLWRLLAGDDNFDRDWVSARDIRDAHPEWYSGLAELARWGWLLELDLRASEPRIRLRAVMPSDTNVEASSRAIRRFRDLVRGDADVVDGDGPRAFGHARVEDCHVDEAAETREPQGGESRPALGKEIWGAREALRSDEEAGEDAAGAEAVGEEIRTGAPAREAGAEGDGPTQLALLVEGEDVAISDPVPAAGRAGDYQLCTGTLTLDGHFITSTNAVLAVKGMGKSYFSAVIAEELLANALPFVVLDPTGAWWGLQFGADGSPERGYSILVVGGSHGQCAVHAMDGAAVAEWVVSRYPVQVLVDMSLMTPGQQHLFARDFASRLYFLNRQAIHVFVDEADELIPQFPQDKVERACLQAFDRLVRRGRIRGVGLTAITQRSAVLSKNVLSQIGNLYALRTASPQDLKAIEGWVSKILDSDEVAQFLKTLGGLKRGHAWCVSPGRKPLAERITVRKKRTYDSSRTPEIGEAVVDPPTPEHRLSDDFDEYLTERRRPDADESDDEEGVQDVGG